MTRPGAGRSRFWRWLWRGAVACLVLIALILGTGAGVLYGSLPKTSGEIEVQSVGAPVTISRDGAGVVTITAKSQRDAYFALGFVHAQDRMFQMESSRRLAAGRLSEIFGEATLRTDKLMRTLGLAAQAEAQYRNASPEFKAALDAYAAGVNAQMRSHWIPAPERLLAWYPIEDWRPTDSLLWGRLMAWRLSGNAGQEIINEHLRTRVKPGLLPFLLREEGQQAALPGFAPSRSASNNWAMAGRFTESGAPLFANDPHLGLSAPATWYMARIVTPDLSLTGATAPGLPFLVIGTNGHVAWGFTTTHSDTQDLFEEKLLADPPGSYRTPTGPAPLELRREIVKVADGPDVALDVRMTRHGPLISDLDPERYLHRHFALAWAGFWSDDRTPEAFLRMNHATDAASFREALRDFHTPQQNIVFADTKGTIGFVAAGRVPVRHSIASRSIFPVPGWTAVHEWDGALSFEDLPQLDNPPEGRIVTANNDIRPPGYGKFIGHSFDRPHRRDRIAELLAPLSAATSVDMQRIQLDTLSTPVLRFVKAHLREVAGSMPLDIAAKMSGWDGRMDIDRAEPLIAIAWLNATAQRMLADDLGEDFDDWWFWQVDVLEAVMRDGRWCDDATTQPAENCRDMLRRAMADALDRLRAVHGADWRTWRWGHAHTMYFRHPVFSRIPVIGDYLVPSVPAFGDQFTVSRAGMAIQEDGATFPDVHGPGMRMVVDLSRPAALAFNLAGGQSGHPLSRHYSDLLLEWAAGSYRTFQAPAEDILTLRPAHEEGAP